MSLDNLEVKHNFNDKKNNLKKKLKYLPLRYKG